jgi:hypothetical protein
MINKGCSQMVFVNKAQVGMLPIVIHHPLLVLVMWVNHSSALLASPLVPPYHLVVGLQEVDDFVNGPGQIERTC